MHILCHNTKVYKLFFGISMPESPYTVQLLTATLSAKRIFGEHGFKGGSCFLGSWSVCWNIPRTRILSCMVRFPLKGDSSPGKIYEKATGYQYRGQERYSVYKGVRHRVASLSLGPPNALN